jgi:hypothetical protein
LFLLALATTEWTRFPLVPVINRLELPMGAVAGMVIVRVVTVVVELGLKSDVAPCGMPLTERSTAELNPLEPLMVTT